MQEVKALIHKVAPSQAPVIPGCDTDAVLRRVLAYDDERIAELRAAGALG